MLPPAFIAQIARPAPFAPAAARPSAQGSPAETRPPRATPAAGALRRQACRVGGWTLGWTAFQWWAVIGWPDGVGTAATTLLTTGSFGLVALAVWRDVSGSLDRTVRRASPPGRVVTLPLRSRPAAEPDPPADLAA